MATNPILQNVYNKSAALSSAVDKAQPQLEAISIAEQGAYDNSSQVLRQAAAADGAIASAKVAGDYAAQQSAIMDALRLGGDNGDATGIRAELSENYILNRREAAKQMRVIQEKKSVGLFDDPIEYLMNALTIGDDISKHNAANEAANESLRQIQEINATTNQNTQRTLALASTLTATSAADAATKAASASLVLANNAEIQGYLANAAGIKAVLQIKADDLTAAASSYNAWSSNQHLLLAQNREAREAAKEKEQKLGDEELANDIAGKIRTGYQVMYPTNPEKWFVPTTTKLLSMIRGKVPMDPQMQLAYERGRDTFYSPDPQKRVLGDTPMDALQALRFTPDLSEDAKVTAKFLQQNKDGVATDPAYVQAKASKDEAGMRKAMNDFLQKKLDSASGRIDGVGNPYWLPAINQLAKTMPEFQKLPLYANVIAPAEAAGVDLGDPKIVMQLAIKGVEEGKININDAMSQLAAMYKLGQVQNTESKQFSMFGLQPKAEYNVDGTNYADPQELMRAALKAKALRVLASGFAGSSTPIPVATTQK